MSTTSRPARLSGSSRSAAPGPAVRTTRPARYSTCCGGCHRAPSRRRSYRPPTTVIRIWGERRSGRTWLQRPGEPAAQILLYGRPFRGEDRVVRRVADGPVGRQLMCPPNSLEFRAQPQNGIARPLVAGVGLYRHAYDLPAFECMGEQEQFRFRVHGRTLRGRGIPGVPDFRGVREFPPGPVDEIEQSGRADRALPVEIDDRERNCRARLVIGQCLVHIGLCRRDVMWNPGKRVGGPILAAGCGELLDVRGGQWLHSYVISGKPYGHGVSLSS